MTFEIAPSLSWTLFNGTKLVNATRLARAQLDESIHQFNQTVLTAVQETDNAMNGYRNSIKQIVALREVCNQGEETLKLSLDLYKQGLTLFKMSGCPSFIAGLSKPTDASTRKFTAGTHLSL